MLVFDKDRKPAKLINTMLPGRRRMNVEMGVEKNDNRKVQREGAKAAEGVVGGRMCLLRLARGNIGLR